MGKCLLAGCTKRNYIKKKNEVFVTHFLNIRVKPNALEKEFEWGKIFKGLIISLLF